MIIANHEDIVRIKNSKDSLKEVTKITDDKLTGAAKVAAGIFFIVWLAFSSAHWFFGIEIDVMLFGVSLIPISVAFGCYVYYIKTLYKAALLKVIND